VLIGRKIFKGQKIMNLFEYNKIPERMMTSMTEYIETGRPMGHFLTAVFANDLSEAVKRGDAENVWIIPIYMTWVLNFAPIGSMGSYEKVDEWVKKGGREEAKTHTNWVNTK